MDSPGKSQPLHNFTLPQLKWNNDGNSSGRRRTVKSPSMRANTSSASPLPLSPAVGSPVGEPVNNSPTGGEPVLPHSPKPDSASKSEASGGRKGTLIAYRRNHPNKLTLDGTASANSSPNPDRAAEKSETKSKGKEVVDGPKKTKLVIKIPNRSNKAEEEKNPKEEAPAKIKTNDGGPDETDHGVQEEAKTWNLRPRKPIYKTLNENEGIALIKDSVSALTETNKAQAQLRNLSIKSGENEGNSRGGGAGEKKEKKKLGISVSLTKEEIAEDIFALTGAKPSRRPKKRAKNVQNQIDLVFPGLRLTSISADTYKVSESAFKGR